MRTVSAALVLALALGTLPVRAAEIAEAAAEADNLAQAGRHREAYDRLLAAADQIAAAAPLQFRALVLVTQEGAGFGVYEPRASNVYRQGEPIHLYTEPFGYGWGREGDLVTIAFEARVQVTTTSGQVVIQPRTGPIVQKSRRLNREFAYSLSYEPQDLKPGEYLLAVDFKDLATGKTAGARIPFRIE